MNDVLATRLHGGVLEVTLSSPARRNALSRALLSALEAALADLDPEITGVVLDGAGGTFSAGADFAELTGTSADIAYDEAVTRVREAIISCPRLVVAAIEGPCLGAAADLALACDLRVVAGGGSLQVPAVRLGLLYNPDALTHHARSYPLDTVRRLFLLGESFDADAARAAGLASAVVPRGAAAEHALRLAAAITPGEIGAFAATKAFLRAVLSGTADTEEWQQRRTALLDSPARRAAIDAARARHTDHRHHETKDPR